VTVHTALRRCDVVLVAFPFTDLSGVQRRPALIVGRVQTHDLLLAFMTSQIAVRSSSLSRQLDTTDPEFLMSGLKVCSTVRLDRLVTLHRRLVTRRLGSIGPQTAVAIARCLRYVFDL
jgi:mRNA interferase MazF